MFTCLDCEQELPREAFATSNGRRHVYCRPCQRLRDQERYQRDRAERPHVILWRNAKLRAKWRGYEFDITPEDIVVPKLCPVYGVPFEYGYKGAPGDWAPTLDRIDPNKGYVKGNIAVISYRANTIKNKGSLDDFKRILAWLEKQNG